MPIIIPNKHASPVFYPQLNYQVVKYMDLIRFVSMLQRKSLFFCRLDKLEDHFEGTTSEVNWQRRFDNHSRQHILSKDFRPLTEEEILLRVEQDYERDRKAKAIKTVCCWNISNSESAALWKIYSNINQGIMITSKVTSIIEAFKETKENIDLSEVKYLNHSCDKMPDGNIMYPVIHKHLAYSYEKELRMIHTVDYGPGLLYDWSREEVDTGKYIPVNLNELIDEVIMSPYSPPWFFKLVENLCESYGMSKVILKSELSRL